MLSKMRYESLVKQLVLVVNFLNTFHPLSMWRVKVVVIGSCEGAIEGEASLLIFVEPRYNCHNSTPVARKFFCLYYQLPESL